MWPIRNEKIEITVGELNDLYATIGKLQILLTSTTKLVVKYQEISGRIKSRYPYVWSENTGDQDLVDIKNITKEAGM